MLYLLMAITTACSAQFTVKLGCVRSNFYTGKFKDYFKYQYNSNITPFFGGIYYTAKTTKDISIETGLQYLGLQETYSYYKTEKLKRHYLALPLALNYQLNRLISTGIGAQAAYNIYSGRSYLLFYDEKNFEASLFGKVNIKLLSSIGVEVGYNIGLLPFANDQVTTGALIPLGVAPLKNQYMYIALTHQI